MPTPIVPASTSFISPGESSSMEPTSSSAKVEALPLVRQRRAARLVQRDLQDAQAEDRALEPDRRQRDPDLGQELLLRELRHLGGGAAPHDVRQHRRRGLRDRAAAALEADVLDRLAVGGELDRDRDLVAAERVLPLRVRVGVLDQPVAVRVLVVVEDDLAIHVLEVAHEWISLTRSTLAARRSTSSG